ncbi:alpha-2-antiplasmin isoform X2 [Rhineura floridana]|uniref:alpha-2-antiplasmin isoform X2 n=1 Tax=Rhineura floridana TaxID=261503 RepID=UPI002AC7FD22|nr:alpha-2-antiplasmin isoform X2 [Rhineura floridana]
MAASSCTLLFACLAALHTTHPGVPFVSALDLDAQRNILQELRLPAPETQEGLPVTTSVPSSLSPGDEISARVLGENSSEAAEDDPQRGCGKDIPPEKMHKIAEAVMKLGADLLREVELEDSRSNLFFSPYSVSLALAHLALGAANQTEKQLLEALHMESVPCLHQALHGLSQHLGKAVLSIAAQLYLQKGFPFKEKFLEDSEKFYGAKPATLTGNSETDLATINNWVKEATDGQISTMLTELPASVVMVLLNAVHFQGFWKNKFDPLLTKPSVFHLDDEHTVSVEMMRARDYPLSWFTLESLDVKVARFPFKGNTSFVVVLPNHPERNFSRLLSDLSHRNLHGTFPKERPTIVKMPKLHLQYHLDLKQALSRLGLEELFSTPNFHPIAEGPLFVSSVHHRAALELAEAGVEASAVTSVMMSRSFSAFQINHPFFFIISEDITGIPLFLGTIRNPNPSAAPERKTKDCIQINGKESLLACTVNLEKP